MTKVLVTGGAGFIGSHVVENCLGRGWEVRVLDNFSQAAVSWEYLRSVGANVVTGDVTNLGLVRECVADCDAVFHLAAMSRVLPSVGKGPESAIYSAEQNIAGTLNVLVAVAELNEKENRHCKVIYSASSTAYGLNEPPHSELDHFGGHTPYAVSKYVGELYCKQFASMFKVPSVCLRYFQVYGPRCPSTGEYAMVTSIFIEQAKRGKPLTVNGDGSQRRDFVHVTDVAEANVHAFLKDALVAGDVINIGTGESHSIMELARLISNKLEFTPPRAFDMKETKADISAMHGILGFQPKIGFVEGTLALMAKSGLRAQCPACGSIGDERPTYRADGECTRDDCPLQ